MCEVVYMDSSYYHYSQQTLLLIQWHRACINFITFELYLHTFLQVSYANWNQLQNKLTFVYKDKAADDWFIVLLAYKSQLPMQLSVSYVSQKCFHSYATYKYASWNYQSFIHVSARSFSR